VRRRRSISTKARGSVADIQVDTWSVSVSSTALRIAAIARFADRTVEWSKKGESDMKRLIVTNRKATTPWTKEDVQMLKTMDSATSKPQGLR
jgi:hypothetical protein